jgi:hypothetical protein
MNGAVKDDGVSFLYFLSIPYIDFAVCHGEMLMG